MTDLTRELSKLHHDLIVTMQAAWIEWQHGRGAEVAMQWIQNSLSGPGLIPDENEPYATDAQSYHGLNRSHPAPPCDNCGYPSVTWGQRGAACAKHYRELWNGGREGE